MWSDGFLELRRHPVLQWAELRRPPQAGEPESRVFLVPDYQHRTFETAGAEWQGQLYTDSFHVPRNTFAGEEFTGISIGFGVSPAFLDTSAAEARHLPGSRPPNSSP
jgi:hypothetical protein